MREKREEHNKRDVRDKVSVSQIHVNHIIHIYIEREGQIHSKLQIYM